MNFRFSPPAPGNVRFVIYTSSYQYVNSLSRPISAPGTATVAWDAGGLAPGVYICRMKFEPASGRSSSATAKFIVVK